LNLQETEGSAGKSMTIPTQLIINGLQIGAVYVVFALGLTLIFGVMKIINFSHGEFFTLAGLAVATLVPLLRAATGLPNWAAYIVCFVATLLLMAMFGAVLFKSVFARFARDPVGALIVTLGLSMLLQSLFSWFFGNAPRKVPPLVPGTMSLLGGRVSYDRLIIFALAIILTAGLWYFLQRTRSGLALRAVAEDREAALLQGMDDRHVMLAGFVIGSLLAALAGGLIAPTTVLTPLVGADYLTKAFIIIIVGGTGSIPGAIVGGFIVGMIESLAGFYLDSTTALIALFVLVSAVLLVRPQGILSRVAR
jgi:branched-chain amino acid transport system permease protein